MEEFLLKGVETIINQSPVFVLLLCGMWYLHKQNVEMKKEFRKENNNLKLEFDETKSGFTDLIKQQNILIDNQTKTIDNLSRVIDRIELGSESCRSEILKLRLTIQNYFKIIEKN
jgi:hypothetical protein